MMAETINCTFHTSSISCPNTEIASLVSIDEKTEIRLKNGVFFYADKPFVEVACTIARSRGFVLPPKDKENS